MQQTHAVFGELAHDGSEPSDILVQCGTLLANTKNRHLHRRYSHCLYTHQTQHSQGVECGLEWNAWGTKRKSLVIRHPHTPRHHHSPMGRVLAFLCTESLATDCRMKLLVLQLKYMEITG